MIAMLAYKILAVHISQSDTPTVEEAVLTLMEREGNEHTGADGIQAWYKFRLTSI